MNATMVVGTMSRTGKSMLTAALCRIFARKGWRVSPFKGQSTATYGYVTASGGEIDRSQAVQAWAAGINPLVEMNPVLLKPQDDLTSQVLLQGKAVGRIRVGEPNQQFMEMGWQAIRDSLNFLNNQFDLIVCEGDGSLGDVHLQSEDLANMRVASFLQAPTILVADMDRGGGFAQVIGTLELMPQKERGLIQGIVLNKCRISRSRLQAGIKWLEERTKIPVLGVLPWIEAASPLDDSISILERHSRKIRSELTVAVIRLPRIAYVSDFDSLEAEPSVTVKYVSPKQPLGYPDAVILPDSRSAIADLLALQKTNMAEELKNYVAAGGTLLGICSGFQMLGQNIADPDGIQGIEGRYDALGLLPIKSTITGKQVSRQRQVVSLLPQEGLPITGYEIHHSRLHINKTEGMVNLFDDAKLGMVDTDHLVWGTYLHGLFDNGPWRRTWLNCLRQRRGLPTLPTGIPDYRDQREMLLDAIADVVQESLNLEPILSCLSRS